jgi:hypothetical protein
LRSERFGFQRFVIGVERGYVNDDDVRVRKRLRRQAQRRITQLQIQPDADAGEAVEVPVFDFTDFGYGRMRVRGDARADEDDVYCVFSRTDDAHVRKIAAELQRDLDARIVGGLRVYPLKDRFGRTSRYDTGGDK